MSTITTTNKLILQYKPFCFRFKLSLFRHLYELDVANTPELDHPVNAFHFLQKWFDLSQKVTDEANQKSKCDSTRSVNALELYIQNVNLMIISSTCDDMTLYYIRFISTFSGKWEFLQAP